MSMPDRPGGSEFPDWINALRTEPLQRPASSSVTVHHDTPEWPLLVDAAVVTGFLPRDLAPESIGIEHRPAAERAVLRFAETVYQADGVRWSVTPQARRVVLQQAFETGDLEPALARTAERFTDPVTVALRECLGGKITASAATELPTLEARRAAVSLLAGLPRLELPSLEELDRQIEFRRLVAQFERMVGKTSGGDRFFGRVTEQQDLDSYVDVVGAQGLAPSLARIGTRVRNAVTGVAPLVVFGVGGVGKTTLLCKFMLKHVAAANATFPFVYLDFDRSTISARDRAGLLMEMCTQVAAQFGELTAPLIDLRARTRETGLRMASRPEGDAMELLGPCVEEFRSLVDGYLSRQESFFTRLRPFLLVLDTFEVVQYTTDDVRRIEEFITELSSAEKPWRRLRLIISGRQNVDSFGGDLAPKEIGALDPAGSRDMLVALAADAGKPITSAVATALVSALAAAAGERTGGVHPLRLRLVGTIFGLMDGNGTTVAMTLIEDLKQPAGDRNLTQQILVDGVLVRRVLGHVADSRVRALADPGLVVRRITPDVIRHVMAAGTPPPAPDGDAAPSKETSWSLQMDDEEARDIFAAFQKEVSLVERDDDGALRHRADVRLQMLPLIRTRSPQQFKRLHELAFEHFSAAVTRDPADWKSLGEAIYHALWLGRPLEDINRLWRPEPTFDPRISDRDFPDDSLAYVFVRAKGNKPLSPGELRRLPAVVALDWFDRQRDDFLGARRVEDIVDTVRVVGGAGYGAFASRPTSAAAGARLLMRAGLWDEAATIADRGFRDAPFAAAALSLLRTRVTIEAKSPSPGPIPLDEFRHLTKAIADPVIRVELAAHLACAAMMKGEHHDQLRQEVAAHGAELPVDRWMRDTRILRLFVLTVPRVAHREIAAFWEQTDRLPRDPRTVPLLRRLLDGANERARGIESLLEPIADPKKRSPRAFDALDLFWRENRASVLARIREHDDTARAARSLAVFDHADWHWVLGNALGRELRDDPSLERVLQVVKPPAKADGLTIVQHAANHGELLRLAAAIAEAGYRKPESAPYPQSVFGIANALVQWHERLERLTTGVDHRDAE